MIQEQNPLQQQQQQIQTIPEAYEQVEFINSSDQAVCITGLEALNYTNSSIMPIVIRNSQPQQQQQQIKNLNPKKKIILITSPNTTVLRANNLNQAALTLSPSRQYQTIKTIQRARIIPRTTTTSAPFLPSVPSTTPTVKQNSPLKIVSIKTAHPETHSSINRLKNNSKEIGSLKSFLKPCKSNSQIKIQNRNQNQEQLSKTEKPTLATMAGIQLTGSMESLPAAMSGAMQNATATVEEINVPVFIDEYLQQTTSSAANSINNDNITSSTFAANTDNGNGNKAFNIDDCDLFENFEFDLNLISTDDYEVSSGATKKSEAALFNISAQQQQQQQADDMYNINGYSNASNIMNNNYSDDLQKLLEDIIKPEVEYEDGIQEQYHILPQSNTEELYSADEALLDADINIMDFGENAIDFTDANDDVELQELMNSQNNPLLSSSCLTSSQSLIIADLSRAIATAVPEVPELTSDVVINEEIPNNAIKTEPISMSVESNDYVDDSTDGVSYSCSTSGAIKRKSQQKNIQTASMREKRRKLHLDTSMTTAYSDCNTLTTPGVIELIDKMGADNKHNIMNFNKNTQDIVTELLSVSNSSFAESFPRTPFTFTGFDESEEEISPSTPQSCYSSSYSTIYKNTKTSPNSPALSTISNATRTTSATKSKRGRPPKPHSDKPDPSLLLNCTESERKRLEDRAKNNEASRLSRLKNKQREDEEIEIEGRLQAGNDELNRIFRQLLKDEKKLKRALEAFLMHQR